MATRFTTVAAGMSAVVDRLHGDDWERPTPCADWVARDVVQHMAGWIPYVIGRSGVEPFAGPPVDDDPAVIWHTLNDWLQSLLDDPATAAIEFDAGPPGRMTVAEAIDRIVLGDVLIHTWDLADSVGIEVRLDAPTVHDMLIGLQPMDDLLRASGHYGPKVDVADDTDEQTRLLAFVGRTG